MRISPIQPIQLWVNGQTKEGNFLTISCTTDNLLDFAVFQFRIFEIEDVNSELISGYVYMEGQAYQDWGNQPDINQAALIWVAQQLNITLI